MQLKAKIVFKSGRTLEIKDTVHYKGQFKKWFNANFIVPGSTNKLHDFVIWDGAFINIREIEYIEEMN